VSTGFIDCPVAQTIKYRTSIELEFILFNNLLERGPLAGCFGYELNEASQ
jgi:hypothetical protein